jgi:Tfp pilus assembly protein PilO
MERTDRNETDSAQKTKLIFYSLAALVVVLLVWSVVVAGKARSERDALKQELDIVKSDNVKLEQMVKDLNQENDTLKKKVQQLEAKAKAKPAAPAKKKPAKGKKSSKSSKTR